MAVPIAAIISGGVATGGAITNYYANRETNAANEAINQRNLEYQYAQWLRERDEANRQRLEDRSWFEQDRAHQELRDDEAYQREFNAYRNLGLNPYLMMQQHGLGAAQSPVGSQSPSVSVPHGSAPNQIPMHSPNLDFSGIANLANSVIGFVNSQREQNRADKLAQSNIEYNQVRGWSDMIKAASDAKNAATDKEYKSFLGKLADVQRQDFEFNVDFKRQTAELDKLSKDLNNQLLQDTIRHQQQQDAVAWFNAQTGRLSANSQKVLNDKMINKLSAEIIDLQHTNFIRSQNLGRELNATSSELRKQTMDNLLKILEDNRDYRNLSVAEKDKLMRVLNASFQYIGRQVDYLTPFKLLK